MIDKSKVKKMWVWNGNIPNPKNNKRYVIDICQNGCLAVNSSHEADFENGNIYGAIIWDHCEPIKEPTLDDLPEGWERAWYKRGHASVMMKPVRIDYYNNELHFLGENGQVLVVTINHLKNLWQILVNGEWHDCSEYLGG